MKKIIFSVLALLLIALFFSMSLQAQSTQQDLDQVELMKQFIGTWTEETGEDTTTVWEVIPFGEGYEDIIYWQAKGETYATAGKGLWGFSEKYQCFVHDFMYPDGSIDRDFAEFVSDKKMIGERFLDAKLGHASESYEINLITPDKYKWVHKWRGNNETWDDAVVTEYIFTRVKK